MIQENPARVELRLIVTIEMNMIIELYLRTKMSLVTMKLIAMSLETIK